MSTFAAQIQESLKEKNYEERYSSKRIPQGNFQRHRNRRYVPNRLGSELKREHRLGRR